MSGDQGGAEPGGAAARDNVPGDSDDGRPGDFERYALIASLTLVVLALLVWDRWHERTAPSAPPPDRTLRVQLGGGQPPPDAERAANVRRDADATHDPAPPPLPPPAPPAVRTVVVQNGDTLHEIARRELGSSARAQEIADLNGLSDPGRIRKGQVLKLPAK